MDYMNRSEFPEKYDEFLPLSDYTSSEVPYVKTYRDLRLKPDLTQQEQQELQNAINVLQNKLLTPERFNKLQDCIMNIEHFLKENVDGYIQNKQSEMNTYVDNKQTEVNTYIDDKKQEMNTYSEQKKNEVETKIGQFTDKGEFNPNQLYKQLNMVKFEGRLYFALQDTKGNLPTDENYWLKIADKGDKGDTGLGLTPKGNHSNTYGYNINDAVSYVDDTHNGIYYCKKANVGHSPIETEYWTLFMDIGELTALVGSLDNLNTDNKTNVVNAINEVLNKFKQATSQFSTFPFTSTIPIKSYPDGTLKSPFYPDVEGGKALKNELVYNNRTWEEWTKPNGVVGDSTGLEFTADGTNWIQSSIPTSCKSLTKYGVLYYIISTTLNEPFTLAKGITNPLIISSVLGNNKQTLTTLDIINNNILPFQVYNTESSGNKIKVKDIRIFELSEGSQIESDFENLSADELNIKYPYVHDLGYCQDMQLVSEGENLFDGEFELGYFNGQGQKVPYNDKVRSVNFIEIDNTKNISFIQHSDNKFVNLFYYDNDKNYISHVTISDATDIPNNCKYIMFSYQSGFEDTEEFAVYQGTQSPTSYIPHVSTPLTIHTPKEYPLTAISEQAKNVAKWNNGMWKYEGNVKKHIIQENDITEIFEGTNIKFAKINKPIDSLDKGNYYLDNFLLEGFFVTRHGEDSNKIGGISGTAEKDYYFTYWDKSKTDDEIKQALVGKTVLYQLASSFTIENHTQGFSVNGTLSTYPNGRLVQTSLFDEYITLDNEVSIQLVEPLSDLEGVYFDNDKQQTNATLSEDGYTISFDKTLVGQFHIKGTLANTLPVKVTGEAGNNLKTQVVNTQKSTSANSKDITRLNNDVEQMQKDLKDGQRIPFSMSGESVKSTPPRGGNVSDVVIGGREPLVPVIKYNPDTWAEFTTTRSTLTVDATGATLTANGEGQIALNIKTNLKGNTKYGLLLNIINNTLDASIVVTSRIAGSAKKIVPQGTTENKKLSFISTSIPSDIFSLTSSSKNTNGAIKFSRINLYELPPNSEIEHDFETLTPDELADKYPYAPNMLYPTDFEVRGEGRNLFDINHFAKNYIKAYGTGEAILKDNKVFKTENGQASFHYFLHVKPNTHYIINCEGTKQTDYAIGKWPQKEYTTDNTDKIEVFLYFSTTSTITDYIGNISIVEGDKAPDHYTPYNSSPIYVQTPDKHPLVRLPSGVENKVVETNEEYVEECVVKKYLLKDNDFDGFNNVQFTTHDYVVLRNKNIQDIYSINKADFTANKLITSISQPNNNGDTNRIYVHYFNTTNWVITLPKNKYANLDEVKQDLVGIEILYQMDKPKVLHNGQEGFHVTGNLDTFPNGRMITQGYYSKVYNLTDTNTITLDKELGELESVEMYVDGTNNDKILLLLKATLTNSKTITLDEKYSGSVLVKGRPKYHMSPSVSFKVSTNLGTDVQELKEDHNSLTKQITNFQDDQELYNLMQDYQSEINRVKAEQAFQLGVDKKNKIVEAINSKKNISASTENKWDTLIQKVKDIPQGQGNAIETNVLSGKTFTNDDGTLRTGTMPNNGTKVWTPKTTNIVIPKGYYDASTIKGDSNLKPENIKEGITIFGVTGNYSTEFETETGSDHMVVFPDSTTTHKIDLQHHNPLILQVDGITLINIPNIYKNNEEYYHVDDNSSYSVKYYGSYFEIIGKRTAHSYSDTYDFNWTATYIKN